jgi:hypothetical protein
MEYELLLAELARIRAEKLRREVESARLAKAAQAHYNAPTFSARVRRIFRYGKEVQRVDEVCCARAGS